VGNNNRSTQSNITRLIMGPGQLARLPHIGLIGFPPLKQSNQAIDFLSGGFPKSAHSRMNRSKIRDTGPANVRPRGPTSEPNI